MVCPVARNSRSVTGALAVLVAALVLGVASAARAQDEVEALSDDDAEVLLGSHADDFDGMLERRRIRVLTTFSKTYYFLDKARQRGAVYDLMKAFEKALNEKHKTGHRKIVVVFVPVSRDELIPGLLEGRGDIAAANLTITPERLEQVDFSDPFFKGVKELVISAPSGPKPESVDDLSGKTIHVRESSSYYQSLVALNERFAAEGKAPVQLVTADENLEDEDLLEMVNADLIPLVVVDSHKAKLWAQVFEDITLHEDVAVREGGEIGWAFRKDSPKLAAEVNAFVAKNKKGTLLGNMVFNRYLKNAKYLSNAGSDAEMEKFEQTIEFFQRYSSQYDFDWLVMAAVGYQESTLDQSKRSPAGAVGVMQVLPSTASDPNVGIADIENLESNIHAGVKYLHFLHNRYFADSDMPELDQWLMTFASYNAGPAKVRRLRAEAKKMGLDPNRWFRNVEVVAAKRIGRETVQYVSNIYKYYIAYKLLIEGYERKKRAMPKADS